MGKNMNGVGISFISCVNDEIAYEKMCKKINELDKCGFDLEIIPIRKAKSLTAGYNEGMKKAKGKYKVYIHQDVYIQNKKFIYDLVNIFSKYPDVGLMGLIGAEKMHPSGEWWLEKTDFKYGGVIDNTNNINEFVPQEVASFQGEIKYVTAVDGLLIATQYDVKWRDDLFDGWHMYDASQCIEFKRLGYNVCVPQQKDGIWAIHDCGKPSMDNYDKYRRIFLKEYSSDLFRWGILSPTLYQAKCKIKKVNRFIMKPIEKKVKMVLRKK